VCEAAETLREKALDARLNAEHAEEIEDPISAAGFRAVAIALFEVAEALDEEEAA